MDSLETPVYQGSLRLARLKGRTDHKRILMERPAPPETTVAAAEDRLSAAALARHVDALARHPEVHGLAYQSLAATVLRTLGRVAQSERRAAGASISLAQGEKLHRMIDTVDAVTTALKGTLSPQGEKMLGRYDARAAGLATERSWWFALCDALHTLDEGAAWIHSVRAGQPRGSLTYTLCSLLAVLLHAHHDIFLAEAEAWMA